MGCRLTRVFFASPVLSLCCAFTAVLAGNSGLPPCKCRWQCPLQKMKMLGPSLYLAFISPFSENQYSLGIFPLGTKRDKGWSWSLGVGQKLPFQNVKNKRKIPEVLRFVWCKCKRILSPHNSCPSPEVTMKGKGTAKWWFLGEQLTRTFYNLTQCPGPFLKLPFKWTLEWEQRELEASCISPHAHFLTILSTA